MLTCVQATQLLSQRQDRELVISEKLHLMIHSVVCSGCRNFGKQMNIISLTSKQFCVLPDLNTTKSNAADQP